MRFSIILLLLCLINCAKIFAQCGTTDFSVASAGCLNQLITTTNGSSAGNPCWDFCTGDLNNSPQAQSSISLSSAIGRPSIEMVKDGSTWYGFVTGTWTNTLYRLTFANGPNAAPTLTENLGSLSGLLNGPGPIRLIQENNQWFGITYNVSSGELLKLNFGSKLSYSITASVLYTNTAYTNAGVALGKDAVNGWVCVLSEFSSFKIIRLGNTLTAPGVSDIISSSIVPNPNSLGDVDLINVCGNWIGLADNFGNGNIYRLNFGSNLFSSPSIDQIASLSTSNPGRLLIARDSEDYFLLVTSLDGTLTKLEFGNDLTSSPSIVYEGNMGTLNANTYGLGAALENSTWTIVILSQSNGQTYTVNYPDNCSASPKTSSLTNPSLTYSTQGTYQISLTNTSATESFIKTRPITISSSMAPDISFSSQNVCSNNNVNFTSSNQSGNISTYQWDFGDGGTASSANPSYSFSGAATYNVSLNVTASNGCQNTVQKQLQIFNPPQANFSLPSASPLCTNQNYLFTNTTTSDLGSNPAWQWNVNGSIVATTQDLNYLFTSSNSQTISLTASIPGCSSQSTQNINNLADGVLVSFNSPPTSCAGTTVSFINTTSGSAVDTLWTYGDGNSSSKSIGTNIYSTAGTYSVTLTESNAAGCQNSLSKNITIYSVPQPDFSIAAPPLSCSNWPSQFENLTPTLVDSYIPNGGWKWDFGDTANGTSSAKSPSYTYLNAKSYDVSLKATSNVGCTDSIKKTIVIYQSPQAGFTNTAACVNLKTYFSDPSPANLSLAHQWTVQNTILTGTSPNYVFKSSGNFPVTLTITGSNGCLSQFTKNVLVPVIPVVDFSVQAPCTGHPSYFQEVNPGGADPAVAWNWAFENDFSSDSIVGVYQFPTTGLHSVNMITTRQSGCSYSTSKNIYISEGPIASFTPSVYAGAAPLDVTFNNTSTADAYWWQFDDPLQSTSIKTSPEFQFTQLGKYKVLLTAVDTVHGCSDTLSIEINVVIPHIDIVMNNFSLINNPSSNSSQAVVSILNSGNIPLVNPEVLIDFGGEASVKEKISGLLWPGKSIVQALSLQIVPHSLEYICAEIDVADDINVGNNKQCVSFSNEDVVMAPYPNPATGGQITLEWVGAKQENVVIRIFKSNGQITFEKELDKNSSGLGQLTINTSSFSSGLYLLQFAGSNTTKAFRILIGN